MVVVEPELRVYEGSDLEALATLHRYQRWIVANFKPYLSGRTVEFGAGLGSFSALVRPEVSMLDLVEPSNNLVVPLQQRFHGDEGVKIYKETLETKLPDIADCTYDSVVLVNVLEHIENDIEALDGFYRILNPGGYLLLFVPALKILYSDLDALVGHHRRYQRPELNSRVTSVGFNIVQSSYFDTIGVFPWWLLNTVMGATTFSPKLVNIYDIVFAPLSRWLESLVPPPFGKNILLIAQRPI